MPGRSFGIARHWHPRTQNIHDPVHHLAHVDVTPVAAPRSRRRDQRLDVHPFIVGQITGVSQFAAVIAPSGSSPSTSVTLLESDHLTLNQKRFKGFKMFPDGHLELFTSALRRRPALQIIVRRRPQYVHTHVAAQPVLELIWHQEDGHPIANFGDECVRLGGQTMLVDTHSNKGPRGLELGRSLGTPFAVTVRARSLMSTRRPSLRTWRRRSRIFLDTTLD